MEPEGLQGYRVSAFTGFCKPVYICFQAHPSADQDSLVDQASVILADSTRLLSRAKQKADHIEGLKLSLDEQKVVVKNVRNTLTEAAKADNDISRQLRKLDNKEGKASHICCVIEFSLSMCFCPLLCIQLSSVVCCPEFSHTLIHIGCGKILNLNVNYIHEHTGMHSNMCGCYLASSFLCR